MRKDGQHKMSAVKELYPTSNLTVKDLENLGQSFITPEIALAANIYRVNSSDGASIVGRKDNGSYSGLIFPYRYPGNTNARDYRLRRDNPDIEYDKDGQPKEKAKYLGSPGARNKLYYPPNIPLDAWKNTSIDIVLTEGEKKTLALYHLGLEEQLNWFPIGLSGVWNWKGTIGKTDAPFGGKQEIKGTIPDLDEINWDNRKVYIVFDRNVHTNESVIVARQELAKEVIGRGAKVVLVDIPEDETINGIDDLLFKHGSEKVFYLFQQAEHEQNSPKSDRKKIIPNSQITTILKKRFQNRYIWDCISKEWLAYNPNGIWEALQEEEMERVIKDELNRILPKVYGWYDGFNWQYLNGSIKMLRADLAVVTWKEQANLLPFLNGVLHLPTMKLVPHNPTYYLRWQLPYNYNPLATCPKIQQWILETVKGDETIASLLRAYLKAVVMGRTDLQRYLELLGQGGTGKSTYINLAIALVGLQNVFASELKELEQNRFETSNIYNKRLVVVTDAERYGGSVSTLKALVGQDLLRFEKKFENARNGFTSGAMLIVAANEVVQSSDYTSGLERRRLSVPFRNYIATEQRRTLIEFKNNQVIGEFAEELAGLLNWVLAMPDDEVTKLVRDTDKSVPNLAAMKWQVLTETNPLAHWFENCLIYDPKAKTKVGVAERNKDPQKPGEFINYDKWLYPSYCHYVSVTGSKQISLTRFSSLLEDLCKHQLKLKDVEKVRETKGIHFLGLRVREDDYDGDPFPTSDNPPSNDPVNPKTNNDHSQDATTISRASLSIDEDSMKTNEDLMKAQVLCLYDDEDYEDFFEKSTIENKNSQENEDLYIKVLKNPSYPSLTPQIHTNKEVNPSLEDKTSLHNPSSSYKQTSYSNTTNHPLVRLAQEWLDSGVLDTIPKVIELPDGAERHNPGRAIYYLLLDINGTNVKAKARSIQQLPEIVADIRYYLANASGVSNKDSKEKVG
jgi:P4 family phage/plasmid primase-like protien